MPVTSQPADSNQYLYWIALKKVSGVGNLIFRRLVKRFGEPECIVNASMKDLLSVDGMTPRIVRAMHGAIKGEAFSGDVRREFDLIRRRGYRIITQTDEGYPRLLLEIHDPPPYLYANGCAFNLSPTIAIVGSRHPTSYGVSMARRLGADLAARGFIVASGMAAGIDTAAHKGALSAGGKTAAVLGSGLAVIYPPQNTKLYHHIVDSGVVLSELPPLEPPNAYNFPARNRIISGMSLGTVVVEAAKKSGSLITAMLAAEQGRDVFAVPGSIESCKSIGAHSLLKQGAKLVENVDDIIEEYSHLTGILEQGRVFSQSMGVSVGRNEKVVPMGLTQAESDVYYLLEPYPVHIDDLARKAGIDSAGLSATLLKLELMGKAVQMPGKYFISSGEK